MTEQYPPQQEPMHLPPPEKKKRFGGLKLGCIITLAVVVGIIIAIVLLVVLIGKAMEDAEDESKEGGISMSEYRSVKLGTDKADVIDKLGKPDDTDHDWIKGLGKSSCIYYPDNDEFLTLYQFCFDGKDKLDHKSVG